MTNIEETTIQEIDFHVIRRGEEEPQGPYTQNQLIDLLNRNRIRPFDYVYYPELSGWKRISEVFELEQEISHLVEEGQDILIANESYDLVDRCSESGEEIFYVAVQHMPALSLSAAVHLSSPKSIVLTNYRICIIARKMLGNPTLTEYPLGQIQRVVARIKTKQADGIFEIDLNSGETIEVDKLPFAQLNQLDILTPKFLRQSRGE